MGIMKKISRFLRKCDDGVAAVEFALIAPVLFSILIATLDFAMFVHQKMMLDILTRDAVQYVVQGGNVADVGENIIETSNVYTQAQDNGRPFDYEAVQECECSDGSTIDCGDTCPAGDYVRSFCSVTATSEYEPLVPYPGVSEDAVEITGFSRMQFNW